MMQSSIFSSTNKNTQSQFLQPNQSSPFNLFGQNSGAIYPANNHQRSCKKCKRCMIFLQDKCSHCVRQQQRQITSQHLNTLNWLKNELHLNKQQNAKKEKHILDLQLELKKYKEEQRLRKEGKIDQQLINNFIKNTNSNFYRLLTQQHQLAWTKIYSWADSFTKFLQQAVKKTPSQSQNIAQALVRLENQVVQVVKLKLNKVPEEIISILNKCQQEKKNELKHLHSFQQEMYKLVETQVIKFEKNDLQFSEQRVEEMVAPLRKDIVKGEEFLRELKNLKQKTTSFLNLELFRSNLASLQSRQNNHLQAQPSNEESK